MSNITSNPADLPVDTTEDIAARQIAAAVPQPVQDRMEALRPRATELLRLVGPAILDLKRECAEVRDDVNRAFGSRPGEYEYRFLGTGYDFALGIIGFLGELAGHTEDPDKSAAMLADVMDEDEVKAALGEVSA